MAGIEFPNPKKKTHCENSALRGTVNPLFLFTVDPQVLATAGYSDLPAVPVVKMSRLGSAVRSSYLPLLHSVQTWWHL